MINLTSPEVLQKFITMEKVYAIGIFIIILICQLFIVWLTKTHPKLHDYYFAINLIMISLIIFQLIAIFHLIECIVVPERIMYNYIKQFG